MSELSPYDLATRGLPAGMTLVTDADLTRLRAIEEAAREWGFAFQQSILERSPEVDRILHAAELKLDSALSEEGK